MLVGEAKTPDDSEDGEISYPDGRRYKGGIESGKRHGRGTIFFVRGSVVVDGKLQLNSLEKETMDFVQHVPQVEECERVSRIRFGRSTVQLLGPAELTLIVEDCA